MSNTFPDGTEFGEYRILSTLGSGGFATVYEAESINPAIRRKVALKILHEQLGSDVAFRERFFRESMLASELDHPNIVTVYDAGEHDGRFFIAMRYVEGKDLKAKLAEGPLSPPEAASVIAQVASALDRAHASGLVHRDVKPGNVLLPDGRTDHVYLADFGLTKETEADQSLTQVGQFLGTLYYAAPEQIEGKDLDGRSDQYALGCMLYECLTGEPPFKGEIQAIIGAHLTREAPKATAAVPDLPPAIDGVIGRAMAKDPADRYDSCGELGAEATRALRAPSPDETVVTGQLGVPPVPATPPPAADPSETIIGQTPPGGYATPSTPPPATPAASVPPTPPPTPPPSPAVSGPHPVPSGGDGGSGLSKKVGGVPIWALGLGGLVLIVLVIILITSLGGDDGETVDPPPPPPGTEEDDNGNEENGENGEETEETVIPGDATLDEDALEDLENRCSDGELLACDFLFFESDDADQIAFGASCGETEDGADGTCGETSNGDTVSELFEDCADGNNESCDNLFFETPVESKLEAFGSRCGGRSDEELDGSCVSTLG